MRIVISSGHGKYIRGASGKRCGPWGLDEVDEARHVVEVVADDLVDAGVEVETFHDDTSHDQNTNLATICAAHNSMLQPHDYDVSVHFNDTDGCKTGAIGCEVWYKTQSDLAAAISEAMADAAGLPDRGPKHTDDLYFLNNTAAKSVLIETCFVNSETDAGHYREKFHEICGAIAAAIADFGNGDDEELPDVPPERPQPPDQAEGVLFRAVGTCSWFGGPTDDGVSPSEDLAWWEDLDDAIAEAPYLFLPYQPEGTTGLARRLNPYVHFCACRWDYSVTSKTTLATSGQVALVRNLRTGYALTAIPADWGPHEEQTGRAADLSLSLLNDLGLETDDEVEVIYPYVAD
jgi:hypothetical protein